MLAINGCAIDAYRADRRAAVERGWEFIGHGFTQKNMQKVPDERADIEKTTEAIRSHRQQPRGWLGPGLTETWETPDILAEDGYEYVCDWVLDDQPVMAEDPRQADRQHALHAGVQRRGDDADPASQGVGILRSRHGSVRTDPCRCEDVARVMALVVHPYIMGAPHRLQYFRKRFENIREKSDVLFWTGEQILEWYLQVGPKAPQ